MKNAVHLFLLFLLSAGLLSAQTRTVGLLSFDHTRALAGYNLHYPHNQGNVYLLDNCGRIVHTWEDAVYKPGNGIQLMENGDLIVCKGRNAASNALIHAGGGGELIERRDWDNNLIWQFIYNTDSVRLHHDMAVLPNGNVLAIAWEFISGADAIAAGRDPLTITETNLWPDKIIEIEPDGSGGGTVVWEWRAWDHLVQNYNALLPNFADPSSRPERIDVNYDTQGGIADWHHSNSLDYNAELDQIILCVPHFNEFWIIDHSTTTAEAASTTGGLAGKGGDLLFRWGNPAAYNAGGSSDQDLYFCHDAHWADQQLTSLSPDYNKIAVFNNQAGPDYSTVHLVAANFDTYEWEYPLTGSVWGPADFDWSYQRPVPQDLYSSGLGSIQILSNGNRLINSGRMGYAFEITGSGDIVWEYVNPMQGGNPVDQGTVIPVGANQMFRFNRYSKDFAGFDGRALNPSGFLELLPDSTFCELPSGLADYTAGGLKQIFPNPAQRTVYLELEARSAGQPLQIFDSFGRLVRTGRSEGIRQSISVEGWPAGSYAVQLNGRPAGRFVVMP